MDILPSHRNKYGGVYVRPQDLPADPQRLATLLEASLAEWRSQEALAAWLEIPATSAQLVPVAVSAGFRLHHAREDLLVLVKRIDPDAAIPQYASHTIGVGAVVISDDGKLLAVLERADEHARPNYWKLPGGMLEPGEDIAAGAVREVREETAIETRFTGLLGMRHHHRGQFGTSNLYVVCRLEPLSRQIRLDPAELADAVWMPLDEFLHNPGIGPLSRRAVEAALAQEPLSRVKLPDYMDGPDSYEVFFAS